MLIYKYISIVTKKEGKQRKLPPIPPKQIKTLMNKFTGNFPY